MDDDQVLPVSININDKENPKLLLVPEDEKANFIHKRLKP